MKYTTLRRKVFIERGILSGAYSFGYRVRLPPVIHSEDVLRSKLRWDLIFYPWDDCFSSIAGSHSSWIPPALIYPGHRPFAVCAALPQTYPGNGGDPEGSGVRGNSKAGRGVCV